MATSGKGLAQVNPMSMVDAARNSKEGGSQYLTFSLAGEAYGVDILRVQEIRGWTPVTCIPNTPKYLRGVLNLRGNIVPIIDMRKRFNLEEEEYTAVTVIIVLTVKTPQGDSMMGIVVDSVSDVMDVHADEIKPSPDFGGSVHTEFISGLAALEEQMVMLLDVDKMLSAEELSAIDALQQLDVSGHQESE